VSLKDVRQARNHEAKIQRQLLDQLLSVADVYVPKERPRQNFRRQWRGTKMLKFSLVSGRFINPDDLFCRV
jgi:hypothetical protein